MKEIDIYCVNTSTRHSYSLGTTLKEISEDLNIQMEYPVCGAIVNNKLAEMSFGVVKPKTIEFIDLSHVDGQRMYIRSLFFILFAAVKDLYPDIRLKVQHGIAKGYYCELDGLGRQISKSDIKAIKNKMKEYIEKDIPFIKKGLPTSEVIRIYQKENLKDKAKLVEQQGKIYTDIYFLNGYGNYYYGHLLPSTGYIKLFDLITYFDGILLRVSKLKKPDKLYKYITQNKLFEIYQEHKDWVEILNVATIGSLNEYTLKGKSGDILKISEALQEKKVAEIANMITEKAKDVKVVLVAGPSASGKTTFSKRLSVQLAVNGLHPFQISLDDYFVDREHTPKDENGEYDFEALKAIDIDFFNQQLNELFQGKEVDLPGFDFALGKRKITGKKLKLNKDDILIIEGIHGMNPELLPQIDEKNVFKIFISALTQISYDEQNHISTADNRLLRRMVRDSKYRGYKATETIQRWPLVKKGEEKNIFPYQENADVMFNSSTIYELAVLKRFAEPLLKEVAENQQEYREAVRMLKFLSYFKPIDDSEIPPTSLLREFLGGSSFAY
ncbi:MAG: nucleoside kinase [Prolixibacteraceae bacterium]|nr:nucleoside kinase [Prolixibacteraceae bacterium]MBN2772674.1 nucleoside kinase [Prolixibacteraceae bacterium]